MPPRKKRAARGSAAASDEQPDEAAGQKADPSPLLLKDQALLVAVASHLPSDCRPSLRLACKAWRTAADTLTARGPVTATCDLRANPLAPLPTSIQSSVQRVEVWFDHPSSQGGNITLSPGDQSSLAAALRRLQLDTIAPLVHTGGDEERSGTTASGGVAAGGAEGAAGAEGVGGAERASRDSTGGAGKDGGTGEAGGSGEDTAAAGAGGDVTASIVAIGSPGGKGHAAGLGRDAKHGAGAHQGTCTSGGEATLGNSGTGGDAAGAAGSHGAGAAAGAAGLGGGSGTGGDNAGVAGGPTTSTGGDTLGAVPAVTSAGGEVAVGDGGTAGVAAGGAAAAVGDTSPGGNATAHGSAPPPPRRTLSLSLAGCTTTTKTIEAVLRRAGLLEAWPQVEVRNCSLRLDGYLHEHLVAADVVGLVPGYNPQDHLDPAQPTQPSPPDNPPSSTTAPAAAATRGTKRAKPGFSSTTAPTTPASYSRLLDVSFDPVMDTGEGGKGGGGGGGGGSDRADGDGGGGGGNRGEGGSGGNALEDAGAALLLTSAVLPSVRHLWLCAGAAALALPMPALDLPTLQSLELPSLHGTTFEVRSEEERHKLPCCGLTLLAHLTSLMYATGQGSQGAAVRGISFLEALPRLQEMSLCQVPLDEPLGRLTSLTQLSLRLTPTNQDPATVIDEAISALSTTLPTTLSTTVPTTPPTTVPITLATWDIKAMLGGLTALRSLTLDCGELTPAKGGVGVVVGGPAGTLPALGRGPHLPPGSLPALEGGPHLSPGSLQALEGGPHLSPGVLPALEELVFRRVDLGRDLDRSWASVVPELGALFLSRCAPARVDSLRRVVFTNVLPASRGVQSSSSRARWWRMGWDGLRRSRRGMWCLWPSDMV